MALSKSQLDKLGDRLKNADVPGAEDRAAYLEYRDSHYDDLAAIIPQVEKLTGIAPSSRLKRLDSVIEKLRRQPGRLSRIADIAGCRVRVPSLLEQQTTLDRMAAAYPTARIRDYREGPQFGYRAIHVVLGLPSGHSVELQVRTVPQNMWANLSESVARAIDTRLKYGAGPEAIRLGLLRLSEHAAVLDELIRQARTNPNSTGGPARLNDEIAESFESFHRESVRLLLGAHDESVPD